MLGMKRIALATITRLLLAATLTVAVTASSAVAQEGGEEPGGEEDRALESAREESAVPRPPSGRAAVPGGEVRVSPAELVAARPEQRIVFTLRMERPRPGAALLVTLPREWTRTPASGITPAEPLGDANLEAGRVVELTAGESPGQETSFEIADRGIPAGTYELPLAFREPGGTVDPAGTVSVLLYAPTREAEEKEGGIGRLPAPGTEINISTGSGTQTEAHNVVVPGQPDRMAAGANNAEHAAFVSTDGGSSWIKRALPSLLTTPDGPQVGILAGDPMFAADVLGNIWYGELTLNSSPASPARIVVNRIAAGDTNFRPQTVGLPRRTAGQQDKPLMTIDNGPGSPTFGRLYVVWDEPTPGGGIAVVMVQCDTRPGGISNPANCDSPGAWSQPVTVFGPGSLIFPDVTVVPDGRVFVTWWDYSGINAIRGAVCNPSAADCTQFGAWNGQSRNVALLDATGGLPVPFACPTPAQPGGRVSPQPHVEADDSTGPNSGRVYVVWSDLRAGSGSTRCAIGAPPSLSQMTWDSQVASAPGALPGGDAASSAVGTPLLTDGEAGGQPNSDDWYPWLAVDQTTGLAWASLYSSREDAFRRLTHYYARGVQPDGPGHLIGPLDRASGAPSDFGNAPCCAFGNDYGDYEGLDATNGLVFPVWTDRRDGGASQLYTAVLTPGLPVRPPPPPAPAAAAAGATPPSATGRRRVRLLRLKRTVRLPRNGVLRFRLAADQQDGTGRMTLVGARRRGAARSLRLGSARFKVRGGRQTNVRLKLTRAGRRLARRQGRTRVRGTARVTGGGVDPETARFRFVLLAPRGR